MTRFLTSLIFLASLPLCAMAYAIGFILGLYRILVIAAWRRLHLKVYGIR